MVTTPSIMQKDMQYPEIYQKWVIEYQQEGHTPKETHETSHVSIGAMQEWGKRLAEMGEIKNKPGKRPFKKVNPERLETYIIERHPDTYLKEITEEFGRSAPAVLKALRQLVLTHKKAKHFKEQNPEKVKAYLEEIIQHQPEQTVYLDGSGIDTYLYREHGWPPGGQGLISEVGSRRYKRAKMVAAKLEREIIAPLVLNGTMEHSLFEQRFSRYLLPALLEHAVIVMDIHRKKSHMFLSGKLTACCFFLLAPWNSALSNISGVS